MCKILSRKTELKQPQHDPKACLYCSTGKLLNVSYEACTHSMRSRISFMGIFWINYNYNRNPKENISRSDPANMNVYKIGQSNPQPIPVQFPFILGEYSGNFPCGWIDQHLCLLIASLVCVVVKFGIVEKYKRDPTCYLFYLRSKYLLHVSIEKKRDISEFVFAQDTMGSSLEHCSPDLQDFYQFIGIIDAIVKKSGKKNLVWEYFLYNYTVFYEKLRMVKYKFIDYKSVDSRFEELKSFYQIGMKILSKPVELKPPGEIFQTLPADTQCLICEVKLGGLKATILVKSKFRVFSIDYEYNHEIRFEDMPVCFSVIEDKRSIVSCQKCIKKAEDLYIQQLVMEYDAFYSFLSDSKLCNAKGCRKASANTHKCSRCRLFRYCSQECADHNWTFHKAACQTWALQIEDSVKGRIHLIHK